MLGVTPRRKWAELRSRWSVRWDLLSLRFLRQPLNLEEDDRQFCLTPPAEEDREVERERQISVSETYSGASLHFAVTLSPGKPPR